MIYNNTIVGPVGGGGINVGSLVKTCMIQGNFVSDSKITAAQCAASQNVTENATTQSFMRASDNDFRLTADSPAIDGGGAQCPKVDQAGNKRPQGGACDAGAFEYMSGQAPAAAKPSPPESLSVD
jgi:hypothetical protein